MPRHVLLGNNRPVRAKAGATAQAPEIEEELDPIRFSTTEIIIPDEWDMQKIRAELPLIWAAHSIENPGWVTPHPDRGPVDGQVIAAIKQAFHMPQNIDGPTMLFTNAGRDFVATQLSGAASASAVAKWIGVTANSTAENAGNTSLTGEITTAGGGLIRAVCAYAHTPGTATYTLTNTFTANGNDTLPVVLAKIGVFDQLAVGGTMVEEKLLSSTATITAVGDNMPLTHTVTIA